MRTPAEAQLHAPEFPPKLRWTNVAMLRMDKQIGRPVLVEFFDFARINSLRTLPYVKAWHKRYADLGLRVIGIHSPGYSFGRDPELVEREVARLGIDWAVAHDPGFHVWRLYGNKGWPARYIFDAGGILRYVHYGEGDYQECELAIQDHLEATDLPDPLEPVRPEDVPGVMLEPQTADIALPADASRLELTGEWTRGEDYLEAVTAGASARASWTGGEAWAVLSGTASPGVHETDGTVTAAEPGLRLHGFQFLPAAP